MQIYAYSMVTFILCALMDCAFMEFYRVKIALLAASVGVSVYYTYKETLKEAKKYLTLPTYKRLSAFHLVQAILFALLMRFYFLEWVCQHRVVPKLRLIEINLIH